MNDEPIRSFEGEYRFLSNFWPCQIPFEGIQYPSVEHAYQAAKTLDPEQRRKISLAQSAKDAKRLGREVTVRPDWDFVKEAIMYELLELKFSDPTLMAKLQDTGDRTLIEGNWWRDYFWGVCNGRGQNKLGRLQMLLRSNSINTEFNEYRWL